MNQTEKNELLSKLGAEEADLAIKLQMKQDERRALEATPVTVHKVWEPRYNELYYTSSCGVPVLNLNMDSDFIHINRGFAHKDIKSANRHILFQTMLQDLHKFAVEHNEGWKPDFNSWEHKYTISFGAGYDVRTSVAQVSQVSSLPYFKTEAIAQKAIDTFGDRLKILFEYYNS